MKKTLLIITLLALTFALNSCEKVDPDRVRNNFISGPDEPGDNPNPGRYPLRFNLVSLNSNYALPENTTAGAWVEFVGSGVLRQNVLYNAQTPCWTTTSSMSFFDKEQTAVVILTVPYNDQDSWDGIVRSVSTTQTKKTMAAEQFWLGVAKDVPYSEGEGTKIEVGPLCDIVNITLLPGEGVSDDMWQKVSKKVNIVAYTTRTMNLEKLSNDLTNKKPIQTLTTNSDTFTALIPTQTFIANTTVFEVTINDETIRVYSEEDMTSQGMTNLTMTYNNKNNITIEVDGYIDGFIEKPII